MIQKIFSFCTPEDCHAYPLGCTYLTLDGLGDFLRIIYFTFFSSFVA